MFFEGVPILSLVYNEAFLLIKHFFAYFGQFRNSCNVFGMRVTENIPLLKTISVLSYTSRDHLEEEDHDRRSRIKSLPDAVLAIQKAEKKREEREDESGFCGMPKDSLDTTVREDKSGIPEDSLDTTVRENESGMPEVSPDTTDTVTERSDDVDGETVEHNDEGGSKLAANDEQISCQQHDKTENETDGEKTVVRPLVGASLFKNQLPGEFPHLHIPHHLNGQWQFFIL